MKYVDNPKRTTSTFLSKNPIFRVILSFFIPLLISLLSFGVNLDSTVQALAPETATPSTFSSDEDQILFYSDRDGDYDIYLMNDDGSNLVNLTNNDIEDTYPAWLVARWHTNCFLFR
jgi:hypothetical protein